MPSFEDWSFSHHCLPLELEHITTWEALCWTKSPALSCLLKYGTVQSLRNLPRLNQQLSANISMILEEINLYKDAYKLCLTLD